MGGETFGHRSYLLGGFVALALAFLFVPLLIVVLFSFNSSSAVTLPFHGFSLHWYTAAFEDSEITEAFFHSALVGLSVAAATLLLGTAAAYAVSRGRSRWAGALGSFFYAPIVFPGIFLGVALLIFFARVELTLSLFTVAIGHFVYAFPFVFVIAPLRPLARGGRRRPRRLAAGRLPQSRAAAGGADPGRGGGARLHALLRRVLHHQLRHLLGTDGADPDLRPAAALGRPDGERDLDRDAGGDGDGRRRLRARQLARRPPQAGAGMSPMATEPETQVKAEAAPLAVRGISHAYGDQTVVDELSLELAGGEFVTLLGPSGCGKTTLLRIIAGFIRPSRGQVFLGAEDVTALPPHKRPLHMVFQRPTLFPHLDVAGNVAFGLHLAGLSKREAATRVGEALELVRLGGYEKRRATELSGGQMQRIALARAIVNRPRVLLLDEPLSALDLQVRRDLEVELRRIHRETGSAFVYVTHDQGEALSLSDRIAVMKDGKVEQLGTPEEVYDRPRSPFVARFVGAANVLAAELVGSGASATEARVGGGVVPLPPGAAHPVGPGWLVLRPELVRVTAAEGAALAGVARDVVFRGSERTCAVAVEGIEGVVQGSVSASMLGTLEVGQRVGLEWDQGDAHVIAGAAQT
jgi:ABC-type Fe3+/spermidine/putrescine transport system ATPase subunit